MVIQKRSLKDRVNKSHEITTFMDKGILKIKTRIELGDGTESFKYPILLSDVRPSPCTGQEKTQTHICPLDFRHVHMFLREDKIRKPLTPPNSYHDCIMKASTAIQSCHRIEASEVNIWGFGINSKSKDNREDKNRYRGRWSRGARSGSYDSTGCMPAS